HGGAFRHNSWATPHTGNPTEKTESSRLSPPRNSARADPRPWRELPQIPTRRASEGSSSVPRVTCGIPRSYFGLVFPISFDWSSGDTGVPGTPYLTALEFRGHHT